MKSSKRVNPAARPVQAPITDVDMQEAFDRLKGFMSVGTMMEFKPGQMLYYKGHKPYGVFIVLAGEVKLSHHHKVGEDEDHEFSTMPLGYPYGFDLIMTDLAYPCTAIAEGLVKALFIARSNLLSCFAE